MRVPAGPASVAAELTARGLAATWSWRMRATGDGTGREGGEAGHGWREVRPPVALEPAVHVAWHEHLLPLAVLHRGQGAVALVSQHRDGEILARVLRRLGYRTARGSSTRGGDRGLRQMIRAGREGRPLAFTPDGPRGPARRCKPGVARAAAATGLPVIPVAVAASSGRRLGSWDQFLLPAPGARLHVVRGRPLRVSRRPMSGSSADEPGEAGSEARAERIRRALEAARRRAERAAGGTGDAGEAG